MTIDRLRQSLIRGQRKGTTLIAVSMALLLFSNSAYAHHFEAITVTPDCDASKLNVDFSIDSVPAGKAYKVLYDITVTPDGGAAIVFNGMLGGDAPGSSPFTENLMINLPGLAGSFSVSGQAQLYSPPPGDPQEKLWDTEVIATVGAPLTFDCPVPDTVSVGDRVWLDENNDGLQNCIDGGAGDPANPADGVIGNAGDSGPECDNGIPGIEVVLNTGDDCSIPAGPSTLTGPDGFYLFDNLTPGDYCVTFDPSTAPADLCDALVNGEVTSLGTPVFTTANEGDDDQDSDADPVSGSTGSVTVVAGNDLTLDAGLVCPAKLGDTVFEDTNGDGLQDFNEPGVPDVTVELFDCEGNRIGERMTDDNGMYMFGAEPDFDLAPGSYYVEFDESTFPIGFSSTLPKQGGNDAIDSDCLPGGRTSCVDLASGGVNMNLDCGVVPPPPPTCDIDVDLTCAVTPPPTPPNGVFDCDKPIDQLTMIWDGNQDVLVNAWKGPVGSTLLASQVPVAPGEELTVSGYAGSPNDVFWEIVSASSGATLGTSKFHLSCSDDDMDGPEDCGSNQGDGKDNNASAINDWLLEGMVDDKGAFDCTVDATPPAFPSAQACSITRQDFGCPDEKPSTLTFRNTGADCSGSANDQGSKATCNGSALADLDSAVIDKDEEKVGAAISGDTLTISNIDKPGDNLRSETKFTVMDSGGESQSIVLHTSCSQPLKIGDRFGGLELVGFNGHAAGSEIVYGYRVTNNGDAVDSVTVTDSALGVVGGPLALGSGASAEFTATALVNEATTAIVTASASVNGSNCNAMDTLDVTVFDPPKTCDDGKPTQLKFDLSGGDCGATTNTQEGKYDCSGPALTDLASVTIDKDADKVSGAIVDGQVVITRTDKIGDNFASETKFTVTDSSGNSQSHVLHTSCSKQLEAGDVFGSLTLSVFVPED